MGPAAGTTLRPHHESLDAKKMQSHGRHTDQGTRAAHLRKTGPTVLGPSMRRAKGGGRLRGRRWSPRRGIDVQAAVDLPPDWLRSRMHTPPRATLTHAAAARRRARRRRDGDVPRGWRNRAAGGGEGSKSRVQNVSQEGNQPCRTRDWSVVRVKSGFGKGPGGWGGPGPGTADLTEGQTRDPAAAALAGGCGRLFRRDYSP